MPNAQAEQTPTERQAQLDNAIITMLTDELTGPWSVDEIARETKTNPTDSLDRLHSAGLVHRLEDYVWATRTAIVADELRQYA